MSLERDRGEVLRILAYLLLGTVLFALALSAQGCSQEAPPPLQHAAYPQLCDAKAQLIRSTCERDARCGAIGQGDVDACVTFIATYFGWSGCGFVPSYGDETYQACFQAFDSMDCSDLSAEPAACQDIFTADGTALADQSSSPDQLPH